MSFSTAAQNSCDDGSCGGGETPATNDDARVRYYNMGGMESSKPFDGVNIKVTTDSHNNTSAKKYIRVN